MTRREILKMGAGLLASAAFPGIAAASGTNGREKRLTLYNLHTAERASAVFWAEGNYVAEELEKLDRLLRDFRTGEVHPMDPRLYDLLYEIQRSTGCEGEPFHIVSGYRSPKTNAMLRKHSRGVAKHSLHTLGRAVDIRLPGLGLDRLKSAALALRAGGVGYYPVSGFVHVDTGRVRHWSGR